MRISMMVSAVSVVAALVMAGCSVESGEAADDGATAASLTCGGAGAACAWGLPQCCTGLTCQAQAGGKYTCVAGTTGGGTTGGGTTGGGTTGGDTAVNAAAQVAECWFNLPANQNGIEAGGWWDVLAKPTATDLLGGWSTGARIPMKVKTFIRADGSGVDLGSMSFASTTGFVTRAAGGSGLAFDIPGYPRFEAVGLAATTRDLLQFSPQTTNFIGKGKGLIYGATPLDYVQCYVKGKHDFSLSGSTYGQGALISDAVGLTEVDHIHRTRYGTHHWKSKQGQIGRIAIDCGRSFNEAPKYCNLKFAKHDVLSSDTETLARFGLVFTTAESEQFMNTFPGLVKNGVLAIQADAGWGTMTCSRASGAAKCVLSTHW